MAAPPRLIALTSGDLVAGADASAVAESLLARLEPALAAGLPGVLLREPHLGDRAYLALARALAALRARSPFWLALHDRAHLAHEVGADAVHLSFRSLRPAEIRPWLDPGIALGLSTHAADDAATWRGADYLFHGPLRATPSKEGRVDPVGLAGIERALARAPCPLLALGGVTPADLPALRALGAHGAAARAGLLGASDPARATREWLAALDRTA